MRALTASVLLSTLLSTLLATAGCEEGSALKDQPDENVDRSGNDWNDPGAMPDPPFDAGARDAGMKDSGTPDDAALGDASAGDGG
jgi:hypothetical protein